MKNVVIGIDCPSGGMIKDIRVPYDEYNEDLSVTKDNSGNFKGIKLAALKFIDISRVVYVYIEEIRR